MFIVFCVSIFCVVVWVSFSISRSFSCLSSDVAFAYSIIACVVSIGLCVVVVFSARGSIFCCISCMVSLCFVGV